MPIFKRILKNLIAMFMANAISTVTELVQPVVLLHAYGKVGYADWIILTAAVGYLSTLNFGFDTFINQDLALRWNRGERESYHLWQSTALRSLIFIVAVAAALFLAVFFLPVERWLNLSLSHMAAATAIYFIALQVLGQALIFSYFSGNFMGVGLSHRGSHWNNIQNLGTTVLICILGWKHEPLYILALAIWSWSWFLIVAILVDLRRVAPEIFPRFTAWDGTVLRAMLRPSLYFGLLSTTTFLGYQLPLILLQKLAGPGPVVVFTLMRKLFGFGRQMLTRLSMSMGPEITRAFGASDWPALFRLYDYSERFIFALIVPGNAAILYSSPILLMLWMHQPGFFELVPYILMATVANVICLKEHKFQFQFSTNTHIALARTIFFGYLGMALVSLWSIRRAGIVGFLLTWLAAEIIQTGILVKLNIRLFAAFERISMRYLARLIMLVAASASAGYFLLQHSIHWSYLRQVAADSAAIAAICIASWYLFHLYGISATIRDRVFARLKPAE
jgi:O-antigen/teichoic acid export membrane protein